MNPKKLSILSIILFIVIGILMFAIFDNKKINHPVLNSKPATEIDNSSKNTLLPITDEQSAVEVVVTPTNVSLPSKEWAFNIVMNNHAIELDQDLVKNSILIDDKGKEYKPLRWEGAEAGGHHREGTLIFKAITPSPKSIELKISGVKDVVRSFNWQLN